MREGGCKGMKVFLRILFIAVIGLALTMGTGYALEKLKPSGFLSDYSKLTWNPRDYPNWKAKWGYTDKKADWKKYNKIILDQVVFFLGEQAKYKGIDPDELKDISDNLHEAVIEALSDKLEFVDEPGPNTMRLRIAITNLEPTKPVMNTMTTILPLGRVVSTAKKGITGTHIAVGKVSAEFEVLDSKTGKQLGAGIDEQSGEKKITKAIAGKWEHVEAIFEFWAKRMRIRLDELQQ